MNIRIDGGCMAIGGNLWLYSHNTVEGEINLTFTLNTAPELGAMLSPNGDGTAEYIPRTGYIINNDPGFQGKNKTEGTWPIENGQPTWNRQ